MYIKNRNKGFTLIELLVVIAIIGLLASVVLAALNTARAKGKDAAIISNLTNARVQATLYYDTHLNAGGQPTYNTSTYLNGTVSGTGICTSAATPAGSGIHQMLVAADTANSTRVTDCDSNGPAWAATAGLVGATPDWYCVDSTGFAGIRKTQKSGAAVVCPAF